MKKVQIRSNMDLIETLMIKKRGHKRVNDAIALFYDVIEYNVDLDRTTWKMPIWWGVRDESRT